jgi:hypothetical protein
VGLLCVVPAGSRASDESALLLARGEVAYHKGDYEGAQSLLRRAITADPEDADSHYFLGVVLFKRGLFDEAAASFERTLELRPGNNQVRRSLEMARARDAGALPALSATVEKVAPIDALTRLRRPELLKRWDVHASFGVQYDSNVELAAGETIVRVAPDTEDLDEQDDAGFLLSGGGRYDLVSREDSLVRVEYDIFQNLHPNVTNFDFQSQRPRATASYAIRPNLWAGAQGGYNYYRLDHESYLGEPFAYPFVSLLQGETGLAQLSYRYGNDTYFSTAFEGVRDGDTHEVGASYTYYWGQSRFATLNYAYGVEDPSNRFKRGPVTAVGQSGCPNGPPGSRVFPCPRDFDRSSNEVGLSVGFPGWWNTFVDLMYQYRYDAYTELNSAAGFRKQRYDNQHRILVQVMRPINEHVRVSLGYFGTINPSNIDLYDYQRHVVSGIVELVY